MSAGAEILLLTLNLSAASTAKSTLDIENLNLHHISGGGAAGDALA